MSADLAKITHVVQVDSEPGAVGFSVHKPRSQKSIYISVVLLPKKQSLFNTKSNNKVRCMHVNSDVIIHPSHLLFTVPFG